MARDDESRRVSYTKTDFRNVPRGHVASPTRVLTSKKKKKKTIVRVACAVTGGRENRNDYLQSSPIPVNVRIRVTNVRRFKL